MYPILIETIKSIDLDDIPKERLEILDQLVKQIRSLRKEHNAVSLNFICTHNSRRSHLSQIWAQVAASHYEIDNIYCYSGGTEATAMYPMVKQTLESQGFQIQNISEGPNPVYAVKYDENTLPIIAFSKKYNDSFNPTSGYIAVMTCGHADENCPVVIGAKVRLPVRYGDPKAYDDTPIKAEKYLERSRQIAGEMLYVFRLVKD